MPPPRDLGLNLDRLPPRLNFQPNAKLTTETYHRIHHFVRRLAPRCAHPLPRREDELRCPFVEWPRPSRRKTSPAYSDTCRRYQNPHREPKFYSSQSERATTPLRHWFAWSK